MALILARTTFEKMYMHPQIAWGFYRQIFDLIMDLIITKAQGMVICEGDLNLRVNPMWDFLGIIQTQNNVVGKKMRGMLRERRICIWSASPHS